MQTHNKRSPILDQPTVNLGETHITDEDASPWLGQQVGPYSIIEELGCGGMGVVYRAHQRCVDRQVALKMLHLGLTDPLSRQRFVREVELAARLNHPGIVTVYDSGEHQGQPYFAMELIEGTSLAEVLSQGPLPVHDAVRLVLALARAVQHAHEHGVLHRDLKPANVLLDGEGQPHIADFGLSRPLHSTAPEDPGARLSQPGVVIGTPAYMAPEQVAGSLNLGAGVDIYALGAILYECLTGRTPFVGRSPFEILRQVEQTEPLSPRQRTPAVSPDLAEICMVCLRKRPDERYASASELVQDLERFLEGEQPQRIQSTLRSRVMRWLNFHQLPAEMRSWSRLVLWIGGIVLVSQVILSVLHLIQPAWFSTAVLATRAAQFLLILGAFFWARPQPTEGATAQERQLTGVWFGFLVACTFGCLLTGQSWGPAGPLEELQVYSQLCVLSLFATVIVGSGYCGYCFLGALAFALLGWWARWLGLAVVPLFGVAWALTLTLLSWRLANPRL